MSEMLVLAIGVLAAYGTYRIWLTENWWEALGLTLAAVGAMALAMMYAVPLVPTWQYSQVIIPGAIGASTMAVPQGYVRATHMGQLWVTLGLVAAVILGVGWLWKFYAAWLLGRAVGAEAETGKRGVRAWLGVGNLILMGAFVVSAWVGLGWPLWLTAAGGVAALVAYPLIHAGKLEQVAEQEERGNLAEERRRVLAMVEMGKISGEDGAELIGALRGAGEGKVISAAPPGAGGQRVIGIGACLVTAGFFLPWFRIEISTAMLRELALTIGAPVDAKYGGGIALTVHGGGVAHGLGWAALGMALGSALLPVLWRGADETGGRRGLMIGALCVGTVVMLYVMSLGVQVSAEGLWMAAAGYGVMWVGAVRGLSGMGAGVRRVVVG